MLVVAGHLLTELLQFFTNQACLFLLGLSLLDFANGILYLPVGLLQQFVSLLLGTLQNLLALAFYLFQIGLVALDVSF